MQEITRILEVTLRLEGDQFRVELYDPESGDFTHADADASCASELNDALDTIRDEFEGWFEIMREERDAAKEVG